MVPNADIDQRDHLSPHLFAVYTHVASTNRFRRVSIIYFIPHLSWTSTEYILKQCSRLNLVSGMEVYESMLSR